VGTLNQLTICLGVVLVEVVGYKAVLGGAETWQYLFVGNALPALQLLTAWSFPESPKWLVQKGRDSEARKALQRLRQTKDVRMDMFLMKGGTEQKKQSHEKADSPLLAVNGEATVSVHVHAHGGKGTVNQRPTEATAQSEDMRFGMAPEMFAAVKWAIVIAIMLMFMQQFSGINAVFFYSSTILKKAGLTSDLALWLGSSGISLANFAAVFIAVATIDRAGRKMLLIISCVIMMSASVLVSVAIMLESEGAFWQYSSILFLVVFVVGFEVGLGPIPWLMMAELSPMEYRGLIVSIATACNWGANLLIAQFSGPIVDSVYFYPFASVCLVGILFTLKFIPETNGKTAAEIQKALANM